MEFGRFKKCDQYWCYYWRRLAD